MGFLKRLFGGGSSDDISKQPRSAPGPGNPADDPNMIRVFDEYGREVFITKQDWREKVLLGNIEQRWNDANGLYDLILQALHDGFFEDTLSPAQRLAELDAGAERGAVILAIVYLKLKRLDDSEHVLRQYIHEHGETGTVLTNLAKVHAERGENERADEVLWRALQLDPNQENGMGWYVAIFRERGGEVAGVAALRRIAEISGSWRAQSWLGGVELKKGHLQAALDFYRISLARAPRPHPGDQLKQISGDLGNAGHIPEIVELIEPVFDSKIHGLNVGNNLIKANLDTGRLSEAQAILGQLYAQKRPDWANALSYWDEEIAKARVAVKNRQPPPEPKVELSVVSGPVWLDTDSPLGKLIVPSIADRVVVRLIGSTAEIASNPNRMEHQMADPPGRMSRALPLFLAEVLTLRTGAAAQTLVPMVVSPLSPAFMLGGTPWDDEHAVEVCAGAESPADYLVTTHLQAPSDTWTLQLRLIRVADRKCVASFSERCSMEKPAGAVQAMARQLLDALGREEKLQMRALPDGITYPPDEGFSTYLVRLEQLLAVRLAAMENSGLNFLSGERDILAGNIQQCLDFPKSLNARLLLARTLLALKRATPSAVAEFRGRVELLQNKNPLPMPVHGMVQDIVNEVYSA